MRTLWFNARFLDRPVTGVERVAYEMLDALSTQFVDRSGVLRTHTGNWRVRLIGAQSSHAPSPWTNLPLTRAGLGSGHAWEQTGLAFHTRNDWLVSLCNTGPALKRRHLIYLHDAQPFAVPANFTLAFRTWYRALFHLASRHAAGILVNSRFTGSELERVLGLRPDHIHLCRPGADHARPASTEAAAIDASRLPAPGFVLAVSTTSPNKNFAATLAALTQLGPNAPPCVTVGAGNERVFGEVAAAAGHVVALGRVTEAELAALYGRALALVYPSFYEGFGLPPLEAMAHGCPVIVSDTSALPEMAGDAALYCDPSDPGSIAAAISRLQNSSELAATLAERGRRRALGFTWRDCAASLVQALDACAEAETETTSHHSPEAARCA